MLRSSRIRVLGNDLMKWTFVTVGFIAGTLFSPAYAQTDNANPFDDIQRCRSIADASERLACFDLTTSQLDKARTAGDVVVLSRDQIRESERRTFGFNVNLLNPFQGSTSELGADSLSEIESPVLRAAQDAAGKWVVRLENGSIWRQIDTSSVYLPRREQGVARVRRAAFGSYLMTVGSSPAFRVRRQAD